MDIDEKYIRRAFALAKKGMGYVSPNPMVGAVIVKDNRVIGEGFHHQFGGLHAEADAVKNAIADVEGATMYVNLEPCSHYGKMPPCTGLLIQKKISKVVVSMTDPNPLVSGNGIKMLQNAGIEVVLGVLEKEAKELNKIFIQYITQGIPYVLLKAAMTLDGKIATCTGDSKWVSNEKARKKVHLLRKQYAAVMVGYNTVEADNPMLTCRLPKQSKNPVRLIMDSAAHISTDSLVLNTLSVAKTIVIHTDKAPIKKLNQIKEKGADTLLVEEKNGHVDFNCMLKQIGLMGIDSVLLEGGGTLAYSALEAGCVDEVLFFVAPKIIGGKHALTPVEGLGIDIMKNALYVNDLQCKKIGDNLMITGKLKQ